MEKINKSTNINGAQYIGYQGKVAVSLVKNNKIITTKSYHNSGMPKLFEFLAKCLGGTRSEFLRPVKIKLFQYPRADTTNAESPANFSWNDAWDGTDKQPSQISPYVLYNSTPVIRKSISTGQTAANDLLVPLEDYQYEVTYHFTIPASYISENIVHLVGFYPNNATDDKADVSAYYLFTNDANEWEPLKLSEITGNFSIFIDWTLIVSNKSN